MFPARKRLEATRRLEAFDAELDRWIAASAQGQTFQRHGSQIRAIRHMLVSMRTDIGEAIANESVSLDMSAAASSLSLALFAVWDFFRSKLDQRRNAAYAGSLRMADELAWACYLPARGLGVKEPPLGFFTGGSSPYILRRDRRFFAEGLPRELVGDETIASATARLPFPVIGLPWTQMAHLPDGVVIAHEVGHAIEIERQLTADMSAAIGAAMTSRGAAAARSAEWEAWLSELFADVYACLAVGPAFAYALRDFLAAPAERLAAERPSAQSPYPPTSVRMRFNAGVLERTTPGSGNAVWADWQANVAVPATLEPYVADADAVAAEMLTCSCAALSNQPITTLIGFTRDDVAAAKDLVELAEDRRLLPGNADVRTLFAAVRMAYEKNPEGYDVSPQGGGDSTLARLAAAISKTAVNEYRAGEIVYTLEQEREHADAHRQHGREWLSALLLRTRRG
jgi:hypothetical protein